MIIEYETQRLILKVLDKSAAGMVLDYYVRNMEFIEAWELSKSDDFYSLEAQENQLDFDYRQFMNGCQLRLWIFRKEDCESIIGTVAFNNIIGGALLSCNLGYKLDERYVNNGYMTEAVRMGIQIIFEEYKLHRIEANIMPQNKSSMRVVEKLGFFNEGMAYKYLKVNGRWEDHIRMILINEKV